MSARRAKQPPVAVPPGAAYDAARAKRAVDFIQRYCRHVKGRWAGQLFTLEPWEEWQIIRPLFGTVDPATGRRWYREAMIGLPRKNGKSEIAAACALYLLVADGEFGAEVYSIAGDRKQASLVFNTAAQMARADPVLRAAARTYRHVIEVQENGSLYRVLSADADLQHGLNPSAAIIDEYHVHRSSEQYEAMRTGTAARDQPLIITITTAGAIQQGPAWDLYTRGAAGQDPRMFFLWIGAPDGADPADPAVWRAANPATWITEEFLADQFRSLPLPVFERLHLNRWPSGGAGGWAPRASWDACGGKPVIDPDLPCYVGVDAAPRRDKTAVVLDQRDSDGVHNLLCWTWQADPDLGYLDFSVVEEHLRTLYRDFNVVRMAVDPYAMIRSMMVLAGEGLPVETFDQTHVRMVPASMGFHQLVVEGKVRHGNDPELTAAARAASVREVAGGWRFDKTRASDKIDALVAATMAARIAEQEAMNDGPRVLVV